MIASSSTRWISAAPSREVRTSPRSTDDHEARKPKAKESLFDPSDQLDYAAAPRSTSIPTNRAIGINVLRLPSSFSSINPGSPRNMTSA